MDGAGIPVEFSKGEAGPGQHEINLAYADALEMADRHVDLQERGEGDRRAARAVDHVHGEVRHRRGRLVVPRPLEPVATGRRRLARCGTRASPTTSATPFRWWLGGLLAGARELALDVRADVNSYKRYQPASWAPTALAWGIDNRTCGFRVVGHGDGVRVESRIPGADANPYLAFAATIAAGLHGIEHDLEPGDPSTATPTPPRTCPRVPYTLVEAIELFEASKLAREAFGDDVHDHLLNTAKQEWAHVQPHVTDWERRRGFERL